MKQINLSDTRTFRRIVVFCMAAVCTLFAGTGAQAQTPKEATYDVSLGNPGAGGTTSSDVLSPKRGNLAPVETALNIGDLFMGAGEAGVFVRPTDGAPGSAFSMIIRGVKNFRGTAEPLYIVDGILLNPTTTDAAQAFQNDPSDYQSVQNTLASINPNDIEKIEVLKDAAATAIYGSQGANGVVIITTKMGANRQEEIHYHSNIGISTMGHIPEMLSGAEYLTMMKQANPDIQLSGDPVDWSDAATRTALVHSHYVSATGSNGRTRHHLSMGYSDEQGTIKRTGVSTMNFKVNIERTFKNNSLFGVRGNFGHVRYDMTQGTTPIGAMSTIKAMTEAIPLRNTGTSFGSQLDDTSEGWLAGYDDITGQYFIQQAAYVKAVLAQGLVLNVEGGFDYRGKERKRWVGSEIWRGAVEQGRAAESNDRALAYNASLQLAYDRVFDDRHHLTATLGTTFNGNNNTNEIIEGYKFFKEDLRAEGIELAENRQPSHVIRTRNQQTALYLSACYTFDQRYTIHAGLRGDYTFRYDNSLDDTALYPWVSAAWNIASEPFLAQVEAISQLRLRGGWGRSGRQVFSPYQFDQSNITGIDPQIEPENGITNYYDARWTSLNDEWNLGLDFGLAHDRLLLSVNYYDSKTTDKLRYYYHRRLGDYREIYANSARVSNRGVEVGIQSRILDGKEWKWTLGASFNRNRNRIEETGAVDNADVFGNSTGSWNGRDVTVNVNRKGESVGAFYGYESQGIVSERHLLFTPPFLGTRLQEGDIKFIDQNGDSRVDEADMTVIGNPNPTCYYGLNSRLAWRNLSLTVTLDGAADFDILNLNLLNTATYRTGNYSNLRSESFRKAAPNGDQPRLNAVGSDVISSRFVEDGSYLRLSNIQINYRFNINKKWLKNIDLAFTAKNLCTLTGYSGYTPLVNSYSYDLSRYGLDNGSYPLARTFLFSVKATF